MLTMAYTIHYIDDADKVHETTGGFSTLQQIHQDYAIISIRKEGQSVFGVVGGALDDIAELVQKGLYDPGESGE